MTLVEHLDELRSRIIFSGIFLVLAIAVCFVFEDTLLEIANEPLPDGFVPITLSPQEPFFTTIKLSVYGGILISLPILLYQLYAFILPAFAPGERKLLLPFLLSVPVLFIGGATFAYFVVMPAALDFLLGFNADSFNIELRGSEYYSFFILTLIAVGFLFQIPVFVLAVCRLGIVTPETARRQPPLRHPHDRGCGDAPARNGPRDDDPLDGPAIRPVRVLARDGPPFRPPAGRGL